MEFTFTITRNKDVRSVMRRSGISAVFAMGLIFLSPPVSAIPETASAYVSETDSFPPTYLEERQFMGNSRIRSLESIIFNPPNMNPADMHGRSGPAFGGHPGARQLERQSTRQRIQDVRELLFRDIGQPLQDLRIIDTTSDQDRPGQPAIRRNTRAEAYLIDSGFGDLILDIMEPNFEAAGVFVTTIQELGRVPIMFLREVKTSFDRGADKDESLRRSAERNTSSGHSTGEGSRRPPGARHDGRTNPYLSFVRKIIRGAIVAITHPGFIIFAIIVIGALFLRKSRNPSG